MRCESTKAVVPRCWLTTQWRWRWMASYTSPSRMLSGLLPLWQITGSREQSARESESEWEKEVSPLKLQDFLACSLYTFECDFARITYCPWFICSCLLKWSVKAWLLCLWWWRGRGGQGASATHLLLPLRPDSSQVFRSKHRDNIPVHCHLH